ncbi:N-acetylmuramic acid 6-phosphate etherase [Loigolactobacillus coryniformis]|uniref:N-acetylmuramic acid 6-phosphate etherase n=1 Tax=Loigolactobacillus coryniformis subsp. coryniformis CECT 5711 TaxID=1185325 RepID=J2ZRD8_9LACO|nr:N-acetylmuramic acid 6-phosphate etherase [Loigolactobacillus coryniformis]EJN55486.1 N-acetylmuramic acid 6-phosphate etherase [Loigolactobacillus coryniformis subsp. coryniformis CECT 5711]
MVNLESLATETRNTKTMHLDEESIHQILSDMNQEDQSVPQKIAHSLTEIEQAVQQIIRSFQQGGRLFYIGAGTSGRLGVLDAAECVPTFGTEPEMVQGLIAGGMQAMAVAVEGAEDSLTLAIDDLKERNLSAKDTVVGIAASGRTPYVIGGLDYAQSIGAGTVSVACNRDAVISQHAAIKIEVEVGPEILTGSTRLKAGTAQKLVLNMLSTTAMIGIGKVYKNLMVDVKPTNEKLVARAKRIICQATECSAEVAEQAFYAADQNVKLAIVMVLTDLPKHEAEQRLLQANGFVGKTI